MVFFLARGYPTLHLAMIFDDGLAYDFFVKDKCLQDANQLMKLPKSKEYFGFSDENGVIYFIHSDEGKKITKFHKSFKNKGHITVDKSKRPKALIGKESHGFQYGYGVLLGNRFWTFGRYNSRIFNLPQYGWSPDKHTEWQSNQTTIWRTKKKLWIKGPDDITSVRPYLSPYYTAFASVINSTTVILIGGNTVACFNIVTNIWTKYPNFPYLISSYFNPHEHNPEMIAITVNMDKNGKRYSFKETICSRFHFLEIINIFLFFFRTLEVFLQIGL